MALSRWLRFPYFATRTTRPTTKPQLEALEDRNLLAVYYFNGGNLFGPTHHQNDPWWYGDGSAWDNPFNWGVDQGGKLYVGKGVPTGGDTAVMRGATEDDHAWTVYYDLGNGNELSVDTGGRQSVWAKFGASVTTLNMDRNWGGIISIDNNSLDVSGSSRWQSGSLIGNVNNSGNVLVAPDANASVYVSIGTFTNTGNIDVTMGRLMLGLETGALPYAGTLLNNGTVHVSGGEIGRASNDQSIIINNGLLSGSAGQVTLHTVTSNTGTIESIGAFNLPGPQEILGGTVRATSGSTLNFNTFGPFPYYGSSTWSGNIAVQGSGLVEVTNTGTMYLNNASFNVDAGTSFEINGDITVSGIGKLASGGMTVRKAYFNGDFTNAGTVTLLNPNNTGYSSDIRFDSQAFHNDGTLVIASPFITLGYGFGATGLWINGPTGLIDITQDTSIYQYTGNGLIVNQGKIRVDSGVSSVNIQSAIDNVGGTVEVQSGYVSLPSSRGPAPNNDPTGRKKLFDIFGAAPTSVGVNVGANYLVAPGATVDLRAGDLYSPGSVFAGNIVGTGGGTVLIGGGLQMRDADWNFAPGMLQWEPTSSTGNSLIFGNWSNSGDLTLPDVNTFGSATRVVYGQFTNHGMVTVGNNLFWNTFIDFQNGHGSIVNDDDGIVRFTGTTRLRGGAQLDVNTVFNPTTASFWNKGRIEASAYVDFNFLILDNNQGTIDVGANGYLQTNSLRGINIGAGRSTVGGTWIAHDGGVVDYNGMGASSGVPGIRTFTGSATIDGAVSTLNFLRALGQNTGEITLTHGGKLSIPVDSIFGSGDLLNSGTLTLGTDGKLTLGGKFTQDKFGIFAPQVGNGGTFGQLVVGGTATLGGTLAAQLQGGFTPLDTDRFTVLTSPSVTGSFAKETVNGLLSLVSPTAVTLAPSSAAADLAISDVKLIPNNSGEVTPGSAFSVQFTVHNQSGKAINVNWKDAVFLSADDGLDASDLLLGRFPDIGGLAPYSSRTVTIPLTAPARPGAWTILVAADSTVLIPDPNRSNNIGSAASPLHVAYAELPLSTNVTAAFTAGDTTYYRLTIPAGTGPVRVTASSAAVNAATLSARFGEIPVGAADDLVGNSVITGANRTTTVDIPSGIAGVYFLAVHRTTNSPITLRAEVPSLAITGLGNETSLSSQVKVGDVLPLIVHGTGFTSSTTFKLGTTVASSVKLLDATTASVTFTVPISATTLFVSAQNGGNPVVYNGKGFTAVAVNPNTDAFDHLANWDVEINIPSEVRPRREVHGTVTFKNNSHYSQPAPLLQLAVTNGMMRLPSQANAVYHSMQILGVRDNGDTASYAPGEVGSIEIVIMPDGSAAHEEFDVIGTVIGEQEFVSQLAGGLTGPVLPTQGIARDIALPNGYVDGFRLPTISDEAWNQVVKARLSALIGTSYRSYVTALRGAAASLAGDIGDLHDVSRLMTYLANVADEFGAATTRWNLTAFGRGQDNPFDVGIAADADGNMIVHVGNKLRAFLALGTTTYRGIADDRGQLTNRTGGGWLLTEADGSVTAFRADGLMEYHDDSLKRRSTAAYTSQRLDSFTDADNNVIAFSYNANGRVQSMTSPLGTTTYGYDSSGERLMSIITPQGATHLEYAPETNGPKANTLTAIIGPDGVRIAMEYDALGRLARQTTGGQLPMTWSYGNSSEPGRVTITDTLNSAMSYVRGEFGEATRSIDALGRSSDAVYDSQGRLLNIITPGTGVFQSSVNTNGQTISTVDIAGNTQRMTYDSQGLHPVSLRDAAGHQTRFSYDSNNQLTGISDPLGTISYENDANGNRTMTQTSAGRSQRTTFNSKNLPVRIDYIDGSYTTYEYDPKFQLTRVTDFDAGGSNPRPVSFSYDAAGRVTSVTYVGSKSVTYGYDSAGRRNSLTTSDGLTIDYGFDSLGRLNTLRRNGALVVTYGYDALGRLTSKQYADGSATVTTLDVLDRAVRIEHRNSASAVIDFQAYTYNHQGFVSSLTTPEGVSSYGYDVSGQLIQETTPTGSQVFSYDAAGNRVGYGVNEANEYTTTPDGKSLRYDADGNLSSITGGSSQTQYGYDLRGRLVYQNGPAGTFQYGYDALGNRSYVIKNGQRTDLLIDPIDGLSDVLTESVGGAVTASYVVGQGLEARYDGANAGSYYHADGQGNIVELTDSTGVAAAYRYTAFGSISSQTGSQASLNPYRYGGAYGVADRNTGNLDMRNRFYDPALGRFTQRDPLGLRGNDANVYRYGYNNPLSYSDPSGLSVFAPFSLGGWSANAWTTSVSSFGRSLGARLGQAGFQAVASWGADAGVAGSVGGIATGTRTIMQTDGLINLITNRLNAQYITGQTSSTLNTIANDIKAVRQAVALQSGLTSAAPAAPAATTAGGLSVGAMTLGTGVILAGGAVVSFFGPDLLLGGGHFTQSLFSTPDDVVVPPTYSPETVRTINGDRDLNDLVQNYRRQHNGEYPPKEWLADMMNLLHRGRAQVASKRGTVTHPGDPNDIIGPVGFGTQGFIQPAGEFPYTIHFENKPTATAPAQVVTITQQLDADLNWDTFQLKSFGFGNISVNVPAGLQSYQTTVDYPQRNAIVDVNASFNPTNGQLTWTFTTLDPITLDQPIDSVTAGFLPPDDANGTGEGFVSYSIQPKANAITGTRYDAVARIVFDTEAPIDTPAIFNTADAGRPTTTVQPLPANSPGSAVTVSWPGSDDTGGSGVGTYTVYTSVDGGPWTVWLSETSATSAQFNGTPGSTISFYAIATDNVGLSQFTPNAAQASTTLGSGTTPAGTIDALPGFSKGTFAVKWHTTSVPSGVTVTGYDVYVSINGGAFTRWLSNTSVTTANYTGTNGQSLGFAVVPLSAVNPTSTAPGLAQATTTVDTAAPNSTVAGLPATQSATSFTVNWSGNDGAGAGINRYTVFVSINGGVYSPWLSNTTQTTGNYTGIAGNRYAFYSVATDNVGNVQPTPTSAQATIQIIGTGSIPFVERVIIGLDQAQRSKFYHVQVIFNTIVTVDRNSFDLFLANRRFVISGVTTQVKDGHSVVTLQFPTVNLPSLSLPEGQYRLVTKASGVRSRTGVQMLADRADNFFRLYGDVNGDGQVDGTDLGIFNTAYGKKASQAGYLTYLDWNADGRIDSTDRQAFLKRFHA